MFWWIFLNPIFFREPASWLTWFKWHPTFCYTLGEPFQHIGEPVHPTATARLSSIAPWLHTSGRQCPLRNEQRGKREHRYVCSGFIALLDRAHRLKPCPLRRSCCLPVLASLRILSTTNSPSNVLFYYIFKTIVGI